jgi:hypothetical protein
MFFFLTFPGVAIHEWAHKIFCKISGLRVMKTVYFRFGNPSGYVLHEAPHNYLQSFFVATGPIIFNSLVSVGLPYSIKFINAGSYWRIVFLWLAFSAAAHAFPSSEDLKGASSDGLTNLKSGNSLLPLIGFPIIGLMWLAGRFGLIFRIVYALLLVVLGLAWSGLLVL